MFSTRARISLPESISIFQDENIEFYAPATSPMVPEIVVSTYILLKQEKGMTAKSKILAKNLVKKLAIMFAPFEYKKKILWQSLLLREV